MKWRWFSLSSTSSVSLSLLLYQYQRSELYELYRILFYFISSSKSSQFLALLNLDFSADRMISDIPSSTYVREEGREIVCVLLDMTIKCCTEDHLAFILWCVGFGSDTFEIQRWNIFLELPKDPTKILWFIW